MQNNVIISQELAKDLFTLVHDAKHPHHEQKIVEQVKMQLGQAIALSLKEENKENK